MDEERAHGVVEGERYVELNIQQPQHAHFHQLPSTPMSVVEEQRKECRSLSHLGIFMPLYLLPLLFLGPKYGSCLYCLLLPLLLWAFNLLPKPATALVHLVTVPVLGFMDTERVAQQYLAADVLTMVPLLFLVVVMDRWSDVVLSTAQAMCARFGLRRGPLFAGACACSFACSWVFSSAVASVALLYFLDRVVTTTFRENMDLAQEGGALWSPSPHRHSSQQDSASMASAPPHGGDEVLFEQLAQVVLSMQNPESLTRRFKRTRVAAAVSNLSQATDGATTTVTIDESTMLSSGHLNEDAKRIDASSSRKADKKRKAPFRLWRLGWYKSKNAPVHSQMQGHWKPLTQTATDTEAAITTDHRERLDHAAKQGDSAPTDSMRSSALPDSQASASQADKMPQSRKGPFGIETPFAVVRKQRQLRRQKQQQQERRQLKKQQPPQRPQQLPSSDPTFAESKTDTQIRVQSNMVTSKMTREPLQLSHQHDFSSKQRDDSHLDRHHNTATGGTSPQPSSKSRFQWLRKFRVFRGTSRRKRTAEGKPKEGSVPHAASEMPATHPTHPTHQRPDDHEVRGDGLSWTELDECALSGSMPNASALSSRATGANDEDDSVKEAGEAFVFDALAEHLDLAAKALITASAGVVTELGVPCPGVESEISVTPTTNSLSATVQGSCETAPNSVTPTNGAIVISSDRATASELPANAPKTDELGEEKAQVDDASGKSHSKKRSGRNRNWREKKTQQACKSCGSSSRTSRRYSGRSSGSQTPRASNNSDLQGRRTVPVFVFFREEEQHDLKGSVTDPDGSSSDGKGRAAKGYEADFTTPTGKLVASEPYACEIAEVKTNQPHCPAAREEPEAPQGFLVRPEGGKAYATIAATGSAPNAEQSGQHGTREQGSLHKGSQISKSSLRKSCGSDHHKGKLGDAGARKVAVKMTKTDQERRAKRKTVVHHVGSSRPTPEPTVDDKDRAEGRRSGTFGTAASASMPGVAEEPQSSEGLETPKPAAAAVFAHRDDSKSATSGMSTLQQQQNILTKQHQSMPSTVSGRLKQGPTLPLAASSAHRRSLQSVVSFEEDVKEIASEESPTAGKLTPLAHLLEMAPRAAPKRGLSTKLRVSSSGTVGARRMSSVDFGPSRCAVISPMEHHSGTSMPRLQSRFSPSSHSSTGDNEALLRRPIPIRHRTHDRSIPLYDMSSMRSITSGPISLLESPSGSQLTLPTKKSKTKSARLDVHNAFLMGPSLMSVLGGICSFHASGNKSALKTVSLATEVTERPITSVKWAIVTLPGVVLALVACSTAVWLLYVRPHEPAPMSAENLAVIRAAQQKRARRRKQRGVRYACAAYVATFSFVYAVSLVLGLTERMALLTALTSMMLATSLLTSFLQAAFDFMRNIWRMMPWGVLLLLGATHVASELLQTCDLPQEVLRVASTSFWEERSPLEAQAVLAFATSVMAETTDKRVLVEIMTPAVAHIFLLGLFAKVVVMAMVIATVNAADRAGLFGTQTSTE